jgi:hypothetical protein
MGNPVKIVQIGPVAKGWGKENGETIVKAEILEQIIIKKKVPFAWEKSARKM